MGGSSAASLRRRDYMVLQQQGLGRRAGCMAGQGGEAGGSSASSLGRRDNVVLQQQGLGEGIGQARWGGGGSSAASLGHRDNMVCGAIRASGRAGQRGEMGFMGGGQQEHKGRPGG